MVRKNKIIETLKEVVDPETGIDIVTMRMIKSIEIKEGRVKIKFVPTSPFCPMVSYLTEQIKKSVKKVKGVEGVDVEVSLPV